jgi:hypothetical protein
MITIKELQNSPNAFTKAQTVQPKTVRSADSDTFGVLGQNGLYLVTIKGSLTSAVIDCDCRAGQLKKPCYHAASVFNFIDSEQRTANQADYDADAAAAAEFNFDFDFESDLMEQPVISRADRLLAEQAAQIQTLETKLAQLERRFTALLNRVETEADFVDYVNNKYSDN